MGKFLLCVEDSPVFQESIKEELKSLPQIEYSFFPSVEEAKEFIEKHERPIDIALLDIYVKGGVSLHLIPRIKAYNPYARIIVISSLVEVLKEYPILWQEIDFLLKKPVEKGIIRKIVESLIKLPQERRRHVRKMIPLPFWIAKREKIHSKEIEVYESPVLLNISTYGLSFRSPMEYSIGEKLVLLFSPSEEKDLSQLEKWFRIEGEVVWKKLVAYKKEVPYYEYGVKFLHMGEEIRLRLMEKITTSLSSVG